MAIPSTIGFVGLGQMGQPMASFIAKGDTPLVGFDQAAGRIPEGATGANNLTDLVAQSDTIFLSLPDGAISKAVASDIAAMHNSSGKVVIDLSTIGPDAAVDAAGTLNSAGLTYIDAPVSGGRQGALKASIAIIWAGPKIEMERHQHIIDLFCANSFHVGDQAGQGAGGEATEQFFNCYRYGCLI